jgi:hypothetical protein
MKYAAPCKPGAIVFEQRLNQRAAAVDLEFPTRSVLQLANGIHGVPVPTENSVLVATVDVAGDGGYASRQ